MIEQSINVSLEEIVAKLPPWARRLLLVGYRGSIVHGTMNKKTDDVDIFTVFVHPQKFYLGLQGYLGDRLHKNTNGEPLDINADELRRFVDFLRKGNPNSHTALWLRPEHYIFVSPVAENLISHRDIFISKHILNAIKGHTKSQLKKAFNPLDYKAAAHALRLTFLGLQLIQRNSLFPWLEGDELEQVMKIKQGEMSENRIDNILQHHYNLLVRASEAAILPEKVSEEEVNDLLLTLLDMSWSS